ncbi:MAG: membrane protein insertion efficiency factor YidD [Clostridia bacterium]|nr:membrane protein insertion efficiency factor YidD [Clostridia bacterium]
MKKALQNCIRLYQKHISPNLTPRCRFYPSCSCYAMEALEEWGAVVGTGLAAWRLLRCQPFSKGGYDPVPKKGGKPAEETDHNGRTETDHA